MEELLIEWDWRMQDGIGTNREPLTYALAIERTLLRGDRLIEDLADSGVELADSNAVWQDLREQMNRLTKSGLDEEDPAWESLWRRVHQERREIALSNPLADVGPLLFVKRVPADFSHQLTQYYGRCARPGGRR